MIFAIQVGCMSFVTMAILVAALQPLRIRWADDGDCQKIIMHTVRVPTNFERVAMWELRTALWRELGSMVREDIQ